MRPHTLIYIPLFALLLGAGCTSTTPSSTSTKDITGTSQQEISDVYETDSTSPLDLTALPLGDGKYATSPKQGYVYSCQTSFRGSGAFTQGPWIDTENGTWDLTQKISVDGSVSWDDAYWQVDEKNGQRVFASADLPVGHTTGNFPIARTDDAYQYDRNPNSIKKQSIGFSVPLNPTLLASPQCVGGEVGISLTGVLIFNAFDAGGRDAVAMEIQDSCEGHPQAGGYYHYHGYSDCFEDNTKANEHSALQGYAFDGFGIYGLKGEDGKELSSNDLDECHGHTGTVEWNGTEQEIYHYHFTQDFPYTVGCFRGEPAVTALSSGEGAGSHP